MSRNIFQQNQQVKHYQPEKVFFAEQFYYFAWGDTGVA